MYKSFIRPILNRLDHETAQHATISILHTLESNPLTLKLVEMLGAEKGKRYTHPKLHTTVAGITFDNPLLLAAGWDKEGRAIQAMHILGFGGIEIGTVTAYPQPGNPRPRLHLLDTDVALNYFGFNSPGMEAVAQNLKRYKNLGIPIGINVSKNKYVTAIGAAPLYAVVVRRLYELGNYFVINVSSPNTVGLKVLQGKKFLEEIVKEVLGMMDDIGERKPTFIKIAPDISLKTLDSVIELVIESKLAGIIAVNTFPHANSLAKYGQIWEDRPGGLSGNDKHYRNIGNKYIAYIHNQTQGKVTTIGVGGVHDTQTALEKIAAGATLIQSFTGLTGEGPSLPGKINRGLVEYMEKEHIKSLDEIRGIDAQRILENKNTYSFTIKRSETSLENLEKEYLQAVFQQGKLDTLLISKNPFSLKHGERGRSLSHIYLNHRISLFSQKEYRKLFAKILDTLIREKAINEKEYSLIAIPTSGSPELTTAIQLFSSIQIERLSLLSKSHLQEEKGTKTPFYGTIKNNVAIIIDDVFTSGKTMQESIQTLKKNNMLPKKITGVSLVARNIEYVNSFENRTSIDMIPFITLDEILKYHWSNFSSMQKRIILKEREI